MNVLYLSCTKYTQCVLMVFVVFFFGINLRLFIFIFFILWKPNTQISENISSFAYQVFTMRCHDVYIIETNTY